MINRKIIEVDYGLASSYDDGIEVNRKLQGELREKIIEHELSHTVGKYTKEDFKNDFHSKNPYFLESLRFCLRHPEAMIGFFIFMYSYHFKRITINLTGLMPLIFWGLLFSGLTSLLFPIYFFSAFLFWVEVYAVMNVAFLIYTHIYVSKVRADRLIE